MSIRVLTAVTFASAATVLAAFAGGCSSSSGSSSSTSAQPAADVPIARFKEILVVDDSVVNDARARNATSGPWSFRHAMEALAPSEADAPSFVLGWLQDWQTRKTFNGAQIDIESRAEAIQSKLICPWLKRTPANGCNEDCTACTTSKLDLAQAPFRLIAIVNRMDLRDRADATGPNGEGRLVFALTDGAADDPSSTTRPMTMIMEYRLPTNQSTFQWATQWHALGAFPGFDEPYKQALENITNQFTARNSSPERRSGSSLAQVRTNESVFNWIWQQREFGLDDTSALTLQSTKNTPAESFNASPALASFINANEDKIKADKLVVPESMLVGSTNELLYRWSAPSVPEQTLRAFAKNTCNGCHTENPNVDNVFHVSPFRSGEAKVSAFLNDPANPTGDELSRREKLMQIALYAP